MVWTAEVQAINQRVQLGIEATPGTGVAATKLLENLHFKLGVKSDVKTFKPTGRKYLSVAEENMEWVGGAFDGALDFNDLPYILSGAWGLQTPVAHLASTTAKDWTGTPPVTGSVQPQTYTIEQGDAIRARKSNYVLLPKFSYKFDRKDLAAVSGDLLAQPLQDGITMTGSPTAVALSPMVGKMFNVYLDATSAGLGTTQLLKVLSCEYSMESIYGPAWFINRATVGFSAHVDLDPKCSLKLLLEADAQGMSLLALLQSSATQFLRIDALGSVAIAADGPGSIYNEFKHDIAVKVTNVGEFTDSEGVFALEYELTVCEDATWGKAQTATVTNLITAL